MALTQAEKEEKLVEIKEKEIEIENFDAADTEELDTIRESYNYADMQQEISDYLATRAAAKAALYSELNTLKEELIAP